MKIKSFVLTAMLAVVTAVGIIPQKAQAIQGIDEVAEVAAYAAVIYAISQSDFEPAYDNCGIYSGCSYRNRSRTSCVYRETTTTEYESCNRYGYWEGSWGSRSSRYECVRVRETSRTYIQACY